MGVSSGMAHRSSNTASHPKKSVMVRGFRSNWNHLLANHERISRAAAIRSKRHHRTDVRNEEAHGVASLVATGKTTVVSSMGNSGVGGGSICIDCVEFRGASSQNVSLPSDRWCPDSHTLSSIPGKVPDPPCGGQYHQNIFTVETISLSCIRIKSIALRVESLDQSLNAVEEF